MSLNKQLNNFNKQQGRCQFMRLEHAAISQKPPATAAVSLVKKFSEDTKRLQLINSIRKDPVGSQMKRVIDLLRERRQALTPEQINEECYVDMLANKAVFDSMRNNPKAHYDGRSFSYKAAHNVKNKSELLSLINKYLDGIAVTELKDAYPNVMEDLQALKASEDIWLLSNSKEDNAYPNDFKCDIEVDDAFKAMFRDIEVPEGMLEVEEELRRNGLKPATDTKARRTAEEKHGVLMNKPKDKKKKKKQEISKRTKLTNAHLVLDHPELFNR